MMVKSNDSTLIKSFLAADCPDSFINDNEMSELIVIGGPKKKYIEVRNPFTMALVSKMKVEKSIDHSLFATEDSF